MSRPQQPIDEHGFTLPQDFDVQADEQQIELIPNRAAPRQPWIHAGRARGALLFSFVGLVVYFGFGKELRPWLADNMAKHYAERAMEKRIDRNLSGALTDADQAFHWAPDRIEYLSLRGQLRLDTGDLTGALEDFDEVIRRQPRKAEGYTLRALTLVRLGRFEEGVADSTRALERLGENNPGGLNNRAYFRALGNLELEQGLADIQKALSYGERNNAAFLDTRGYLYFLLGRHEEALRDLDRAISMVQDEQRELGTMRRGRMFDPRRVKYYEGVLRENLAVMHYHRGEVYEALGRHEQAEAEKQLGLELGYNPEAGVF